MAIVDLGASFKLQGNAKTSGGTPVDRVLVFDIETGAQLWSGQPSAIAWESDQIEKSSVGEFGIGIAYMGDVGYGVVAHGPYVIGHPVKVEQDSYWNGVSMLHRFEGEEGQTWLYDDAGRQLAAHDGAALTTARKLYGASSMAIPAGGYLDGYDGSPLPADSWMPNNFKTEGSLIDGWVLLDGDQGGTESLILGKGDGTAAGSSYFLCLSGSSSTSRDRLVFKWSDGEKFTTWLSWASPIPFGTFFHFAIQFFAGQLRFYIDGVPLGSVTISESAAAHYTPGTPARIGRAQGSEPMQLVGNIDSIRFRQISPEIYSGAFVPDEILPTAATMWAYYGALVPFVGAPGSTKTADVMGADVIFEGGAVLDGSVWKHNGCSLKLDGSSSARVLVAGDKNTDGKQFSVECWIKADPAVKRTENVVLFDSRGSNAGAANGFVIRLTPHGQLMIEDVESGYTAFSMNSDSTNLNSGLGWHHVSVNYSSEHDGVLFTIDGYIDFTSAHARVSWPVKAPPIDSSGLRIGRAADGSGGAACWISDVRLIVGNYAYSAGGQLKDQDKPFPSMPRYRL